MMLGLGPVMVVKGYCSELYQLLRPMVPFMELHKKSGQEQNFSGKSSFHAMLWQMWEVIWIVDTFQ